MSLKSITALIFVVLCIAVAYSQQIWSFCPGNINPTFAIDTLTVSPDPPKIGAAAVVQLVGTLNDEVSAGNSTFSLQYNLDGSWINLPPFENDICELLSCPVEPGPFKFSTSINVPIFTPSGEYQGTLQLIDQSGRNISCLTFSTTLNH
ncbi:hypothetical protein ACTA71_006768 [Dictyostelium dimigraforme]